MEYELLDIDKIKPLEMVFPHHLKNLSKYIDGQGILQQPLIVDDKHNIVLDGSHRYVYLMKSGYIKCPVIKVHYFNDNIRVGTHLKHRYLDDGNINISKQEVVLRGINGILFPPRTTRHFFPFRKENTKIDLVDLIKKEPRDVSKYIANVDISEEIEHNIKYIDEIEEELNYIQTYISEQMSTRQYLYMQLIDMREIHEE